jgi:adenylyltransferase/sulfurtransferase
MDPTSTKADIRPAALKKLMDAGEKVTILDVREGPELAAARLKDTIDIPMSELGQRVGELSNYKEAKLVVMCRLGGRSTRCADFLRSQGFKNVLNLDGGISAWSDEVDQSVPKY